MNTNQYKKAH